MVLEYIYELLLGASKLVPYFAMAKILTKNYKLNLKESIFIIIASLFISAIISFSIGLLSAFRGVLIDVTIVLTLFLYFNRFHPYPFKKRLS